MPTIEITEEDAGVRLDLFLSKIIDISRSKIQKLIKEESVTINDKPAKTKTLLEPGDRVTYSEPDRTPFEKTEEPPVLDVIYEDDDLFVIHKPAGLLVHEAMKDEHRTTVVDGVLARYPQIKEIGDDPKRPGIVHRLDKDVSGLMVIAKTQEAFEFLKQQFKDRTIKKEYLALVYGILPKETDIITLNIERSKNKGRMVARTGEQTGKEARTEYDVLRRFATATFIQVKIFTGRTHQIRVHFQAIGYPIVGDKLYKVKNMKFRDIPMDRLFLHAYKLGITLMDGTQKSFMAPLPKNLEDLLETLPVNSQ
ncbi:RluA family pseudouridine synthase [Candidatus Uhrbacteria bacterium CG10_big_fil_rev_8_21_14_0_10_48_16]|uniref:Pseudouridine synthase n=1 Tax=Candidatus Uhrbacteria bacterium CG10_big_fil_rev_8_21_14_0_10_48_16 TaxID=1975038 RepID=A0A2M8LHJ5_9BACT|nr:MAG: RluA family pseudouridine synthase [Candidatus Uhrbacteria bacterium CG10_big_fil_rev_8_21_14_0_10_48_16]